MILEQLQNHLPAFLIIIPLFSAFLIPLLDKIKFKILKNKIRNTFVFSIILINLIMTIMLYIRIIGEKIITYVMGGTEIAITMPSGNIMPIRILLEIDSFGILMALLSSIIALLMVTYSFSFMKEEGLGKAIRNKILKENRTLSVKKQLFNSVSLGKYYALIMLVIASINGMLFTGDLFNLFVFFEILSISSTGLIMFWRRDKESFEAGLKYIIISTLASLFILFAIGILYGQYGILNIAALSSVLQYSLLDKIALAMLIVGLMMKFGAVPLHAWVADVYSRSPAPVTALFVVISQISLYAFIRVIFTLFNINLNTVIVGWIIIVISILSMILGVLMALPQTDIKRIIAYQGVSQTGYLLLGVGVCLVVLKNPNALASFGMTALSGSIFHIFNHIIYESLLFLVAGAIFYKIGTRNLNSMGGLAKIMPFTTIIFGIGILAIAGVPPFNGFASKILLYESVFKFNPLLAMIAIIVSIVTLAAFVKIFYLAFLAIPKEKYSKTISLTKIPFTMIISMSILAIIVILVGLFPGIIVDNLITPAVQALIGNSQYLGVIIP